MNKTHAKRLLRLADYLDAFQEPKSGDTTGAVGFNMRIVYSSDRRELDMEEDEWLAAHPCGTAACVIGHAGLIPEFQRLGLVTSPAWGGCVTLNGEPCEIECIGEEFFGLSDEESAALFLDGFGMTAKEKAAEIREIVKSHRRTLVAS